jgi:hypothetical protein
MKAAKVVVGLAVVLALFMVAAVQADEKEGKEVTIKGTMCCGKCSLGETKDCCNVVKVKEGDKTVEYFLKDKGRGEKYHKKICPPSSEADVEVTGTVTEKDGKKWITPSKVDLK